MLRSKRLRTGRLFFFMAFAGLNVWACGGSDDEKRQLAALAEGCKLNSECKNPLVCTFERCHTECEQDRDCPDEQRCVKGADGNVCQLGDDTDCMRDSQCQGQQVCGVDGECRDTCERDADCTDGQICADSGQCASTEPDKDVVVDGTIVPDNFGEGGAGGAPSSSGGRPNTGGRSGGGGTAGVSGNSAGGAPIVGGGGADAGAGGEVPAAGAAGAAGAPPVGECPAGYGDCDEDPSDCETSLSLITSCGSCTTLCDASHGGGVVCDEAALECAIDPDLCDAGWADCDESAPTGCEVQLSSDSANCGECGRDCGGGTCTDGQCGPSVLMNPEGSQHYGSASARLIGDRVYQVYESGNWVIRSASATPSDPVSTGDVVYTATTASAAIAFDSTNLYLASYSAPHAVLRKPLVGAGAATEMFRSAVGTTNLRPTLLTMSATAFYYVGLYSTYGIYTVAKTPGALPTLVTGLGMRAQIHDLVVAGNRLFWVETASPASKIFSAPLAGGTPIEIDNDIGTQPANVNLATDGTHVYWNEYSATATIRRVPYAGTAATATDVAAGLNNPTSILVDGTYVYYLTTGSYKVWRVVKTGATDPETVATVNATPWFYEQFAVDDQYIYGLGYYGEVQRINKGP